MGLKVSPIIPKQYVNAAVAQGSLDKLLLTCREEAMKMLQTYPTWQPWKNPPRTGPRAGGKRTGSLGRGWGTYTFTKSSLTMENRTRYAPYVQGNAKTQQARALARRGWTTVDVVGPEAARRAISRTKLDA